MIITTSWITCLSFASTVRFRDCLNYLSFTTSIFAVTLLDELEYADVLKPLSSSQYDETESRKGRSQTKIDELWGELWEDTLNEIMPILSNKITARIRRPRTGKSTFLTIQVLLLLGLHLVSLLHRHAGI